MKKTGCKCMCNGKECQLFRRGQKKKQLEILVTVLPNVNNVQLLFVMLDFKECKRCSDRRKLCIERRDFVAPRIVFLKVMHRRK